MLNSIIATVATIFFSLFGGLSYIYQDAAVAYTSTDIANDAPAVLTININGHAHASYENQRAITFTGTVEDLNGEIDITGVSLDFFRNNGFNSHTCTADPNNCHHVTSCIISYPYGNDVTISYNCFVTIDRPYAYGDWKAVITATDQSLATGTLSTTATVLPLRTQDSGAIGLMPKVEEEATSTPVIKLPISEIQVPENDTPEQEEPTPTTYEAIESIDRVSHFYNRIEKNEPSTRGSRNHTESYGEPLIVAANNTGLAVFDLSKSLKPTRSTTLGVIVEIPAGASKDWITIYVDLPVADQFPVFSNAKSTPVHLLTAQAAGLQLGERRGISPAGFTVFHIYARDSRGNEITTISAAARITLILPEDLSTKENLGLYRLDTIKNTWVEHNFEESDEYTLSFKSVDLGFFAIFDATPVDPGESTEQALNKLTCLISIVILLLILAGLITLLSITHRRKPVKIPDSMKNI